MIYKESIFVVNKYSWKWCIAQYHAGGTYLRWSVSFLLFCNSKTLFNPCNCKCKMSPSAHGCKFFGKTWTIVFSQKTKVSFPVKQTIRCSPNCLKFICFSLFHFSGQNMGFIPANMLAPSPSTWKLCSRSHLWYFWRTLHQCRWWQNNKNLGCRKLWNFQASG